MELTFIRGSGGSYLTRVLRSDGVVLEVPGPDKVSAVPHDLAHYIVERELGLQGGFWGRVSAGAVFPGMRIVAGRRRPHAEKRSRTVQREAAQQGTEAEVWVGKMLTIMHDDLDRNWPAIERSIANTWRPRRPSRDLPDAAEVRRICHALRDAQTRWQALMEGEGLTVTWP